MSVQRSKLSVYLVEVDGDIAGDQKIDVSEAMRKIGKVAWRVYEWFMHTHRDRRGITHVTENACLTTINITHNQFHYACRRLRRLRLLTDERWEWRQVPCGDRLGWREVYVRCVRGQLCGVATTMTVPAGAARAIYLANANGGAGRKQGRPKSLKSQRGNLIPVGTPKTISLPLPAVSSCNPVGQKETVCTTDPDPDLISFLKEREGRSAQVVSQPKSPEPKVPEPTALVLTTGSHVTAFVWTPEQLDLFAEIDADVDRQSSATSIVKLPPWVPRDVMRPDLDPARIIDHLQAQAAAPPRVIVIGSASPLAAQGETGQYAFVSAARGGPVDWSRICPPRPNHDRVPLAVVPGFPDFPKDASPETLARSLADAIRGVAAYLLGGNHPLARWVFRGDITKSKHYAKLVACAKALIEYDLPPAWWCRFSFMTWVQHHPDTSPPIAQILSVARIEKHHGWAGSELVKFEGKEGAHAVERSAAHKDLAERYARLMSALSAVRALPVALAIIEQHFPGDSYERAIAHAKAENVLLQAELNAMAARGVWLWR